MDGLASGIAMYQITEAQLSKLEYQMVMLEAIKIRNRELISEINIQFHWLITQATGNSYLIDIRRNLCGLVDQFARISHLIPEQSDATISEHRNIIDVLRQKNPTLAEFLTKEQLESAKKRLFKFLREKQDTGWMKS